MSKYFNIDDILAGEERVKVVWNADAYKLGYLDPSMSPDDDVKASSAMELPLWLTEGLTPTRFVNAFLPNAYADKSVRTELEHNALTLKLRDKSPFYYEVALRLSKLCRDEPEAALLPKAAQTALSKRVLDVLQKSKESLGQDSSAYIASLTDLEQRLFTSGYNHAALNLAWRRRQLDLLLPPAEAYAGGGAGGAGAGAAVRDLALQGPATIAEAELAGASLPKSRAQKRNRSMMLST